MNQKIPYATATSGAKALDEINKILAGFDCDCFGSMIDTRKGLLIIQFTYRDKPVSVSASFKGWAAAFLKHNPYKRSMHRTKEAYEQQAIEQGKIAVYSVLRDWVKSQTTMVECGLLSFEGAFLGQMLLPSGKTVLEHIEGSEIGAQLQITAPQDVEMGEVQ